MRWAIQCPLPARLPTVSGWPRKASVARYLVSVHKRLDAAEGHQLPCDSRQGNSDYVAFQFLFKTGRSAIWRSYRLLHVKLLSDFSDNRGYINAMQLQCGSKYAFIYYSFRKLPHLERND